jgi:predicted  nucleic acid-binding Zn ribbon protein
MHQLSIKFKTNTNQNDIWHLFNRVLREMRENGQINGGEINPYMHRNKIIATLWTFTTEAMGEKYFNKYVVEAIAQLEKVCKNVLQFNYAGHVEEELENICTCKKYKYFVLYYHGDYSPIRCGTCEKFVPLFKIPKLHDERLWDITSWLGSYKACVSLDLNCGTGEKWAMKQQCQFDSGLSKHGRKVAEKITKTSGVQCYYFISNFTKKSSIKNADRKCPSCNGDWHLKKEKFGYFKYKCDTCLLMSAYSNYHK